MVLALASASFLGIGEIPTVSVLGLLLCAAGLLRCTAPAPPACRVDRASLFPLLLYLGMSALSTLAAYGDTLRGYAPVQGILLPALLLMACLEEKELLLLRRLCVLWAGLLALKDLWSYTLRAVALGTGSRLTGALGNPNASGIFFAVSWFALLACLAEEEGSPAPGWSRLLRGLEPPLLAALALTLSIGSFAAMGAGALWLAVSELQTRPLREAIPRICRPLARAVLGMGVGVLFYLAAAHTAAPYLCIPLLCYLHIAALCWESLEKTLRAKPIEAALLAVSGILLAGGAVMLRPSSAATFGERLEMMGNGIRYLAQKPLLGLGPYQWRLYNLQDPDRYFDTWHIHNIPLHIGVELGWIAMAAVVVLAVHALRKGGSPGRRAGIAAFCLHNLMDTSFFYIGILLMVLLALGDPARRGKPVGQRTLLALFGGSGLFFAANLAAYLML